MKCLVTILDLDVNLPLDRIGSFKIYFPESCNGIALGVGKTTNDASCMVEIEGDAYFGTSSSAESGDKSFAASRWNYSGGLTSKYIFSNGPCTVFISGQDVVTRLNIGDANLQFDPLAVGNLKSLQMITVNSVTGDIDLAKAESLSVIKGTNSLYFTCSSIHSHKTIGNGEIIFKTITDCTNMLKSMPTNFTSVVYTNGSATKGDKITFNTKDNDIVDYNDLDSLSKNKILEILQCNREATSGAYIKTLIVLRHTYTYDGTNLYCDGKAIN